MNKISRAWLKRNTGPAITLAVYGEEFLTVIAALGWAKVNGPGAMSRRHASYAHQRIVSALPLGAPELVLHRSELMALVDGLEHLMRIQHYAPLCDSILSYIVTSAERYQQMQATRRTATGEAVAVEL